MSSPSTLPSYDDVLDRYQPVLGLETHVELGTASKMFCGCATDFGAAPNTHTCPVCLGLPGSLPVTNASAIEYAVRIGLALHCRIATWCRFARKNYFYPDMPKNFQISQYDEPLCVDGHLDVDVDGTTFRVEIERVHLEEDTGKSLHVGGATGRIHGATHSLVDYNRAGIPLVEVVTKPIPGTGNRAPQVARAYVTEVRELLRTLGVSDVRMEQGSLRCDVNTSLMPRGATTYGTRTETKNVNSLRSVERAVRAEIERQGALLDAGERVVQETRHFHEDSGTTSSGRSKEQAEDYRYFPEPDLPPLAPAPDWVETIRATLPELPAARRRRLTDELEASEREVAAMTSAGVLDLVGATVAAGAPANEARNWWLGYLLQKANEQELDATELAITAEQVAEVIGLVGAGVLTAALARQVVDGVLAGEGSPADVVRTRGLRAVTDTDALGVAVDRAIIARADVAEKVRAGNLKALGPLVGAVMGATGGQASAAVVRELLLDRLGSPALPPTS